MEYPRNQYLVQSSLTFLSMTFLKLFHYQKLQLVQPLMLTMFNSCSVAHPNNLEQLIIYAETSLETMKEWYSENGVKMNSTKTQCILFVTPNFNKRTETFQITIDDTERQMEDKDQKLGVIFESGLSFEHHIKSLCSRLNGTLSYLNRVKNTFDQKSRILLINALMISHLNYCSLIWCKCTENCSIKYKNV